MRSRPFYARPAARLGRTLTLQRAHSFAGAICQIRGGLPEHNDFYQTFISDWHMNSSE